MGATEKVAVWFLQQIESGVQTEVGPLRPHELLTLVRKGEVKPETMLRKDDSAWFRASEVGGLFEAATRRDPQYFCPSCNQRIKQPPVTCPNCLRDLGRNEARVVLPEESAKIPDVQPNENTAEQKSVQSWLKKKVGNRQKK